MQEARSAPGDNGRQFCGYFCIQLLRLCRVSLTGVYDCQRSAVDNPIGLCLIQQTLTGTGNQQICIAHHERICVYRIAVRHTENGVIPGGFKGKV